MFCFRYQDPARVQGNHLFGPHLLYGLTTWDTISAENSMEVETIKELVG